VQKNKQISPQKLFSFSSLFSTFAKKWKIGIEAWGKKDFWFLKGVIFYTL